MRGGGQSIFDDMTKDDLIIAFFPCIYFESCSMMYFDMNHLNLRNKSNAEKVAEILIRAEKRNEFYKMLYKMFGVCYARGLRMIVENPATKPNFLFHQNFIAPTFIDNNRMMRGDYYVKPTAFWFVNCEPTHGQTIQMDKPKKSICKARMSDKAGECSEERSIIAPDYARNFICDFILGKEQKGTQLTLF